jgi:hypothetical protein
MTTVFHSVGRYEIHDEIGRGGMAVVFRATDTEANRQVALKLVSIETDPDGQQILEAERWGAKLQEEFCRVCKYVPAVYEHGTHGKYFFIAMEYLPGRNLSEVIGQGPMPAARAVQVATQLSEFLQDAAQFEGTFDGRTFNLLLHGDLKPRNIRMLDGDEIKVFDFGIAKALSLSRKVTRNDFGSIAYLSPERLESGEIDAQSEFWALGVLLYEMISGAQPFRAPDTRRLEQRIRARDLPAALDHGCPIGVQAIVSKLLAPKVGDRYLSATAIRDDLRRFTAGEETLAQREGWPAGNHDDATRRTHRPSAIAAAAPAVETEVTRRTQREAPAPRPASAPPVTTRAAAPAAAPVAVPGAAPVPAAKPAPRPTPAAAKPKPRRIRRFLRKALVAMAFAMVLNEIRVYMIAGALVPNVPQDPGGLMQMWDQHAALSGFSLDLGAKRLERALVRQSTAMAERTFARYRTASAPIYEREWRQTRDALARALQSQIGRNLVAAVYLCDGHLRRIDGEARLRDRQSVPAQQDLTAAVSAFRAAAEQRAKWPDPFLGLMRTFIVMEDMERGADALSQAQRYGYTAVNRDWALLGEGYLARGAKLAATDDLETLSRAADAYAQAVDNFTKAAGYGNVTQRLREARRRLGEVQNRIEELSVPGGDEAAA